MQVKYDLEAVAIHKGSNISDYPEHKDWVPLAELLGEKDMEKTHALAILEAATKEAEYTAKYNAELGKPAVDLDYYYNPKRQPHSEKLLPVGGFTMTIEKEKASGDTFKPKEKKSKPE